MKTTDADTAKQFESIVQGFKAMVDLRLANASDLKKRLNASKIDVDGKMLKIDWTGSADSVIEVMDKIRDRIIKHFKEGGHRGGHHAHKDKHDSSK